MTVRALVALALVTLLAGCGAPFAPGTPTPLPTEQPPILGSPVVVTPIVPAPGTPVPDPSPLPAPVAGTPTPSGGVSLPAPVYFVEAETRQVWRLERDAQTLTQITFEAMPVQELAVAADTGTLAYVVGERLAGDDMTLVLLDGEGRRELVFGQVSAPAISPDGQRIAYYWFAGQDESPMGAWSSARTGGRPVLVLADEPSDNVYDSENPAWTYRPVGWSPDGTRLALVAFDVDGPGIPGGEVVILGAQGEPVRGFSCCEAERWSADSAAMHVGGGGPGPDVRYGLYRIDVATGAATAVIEQQPDGAVPLVTAPQQLADGQLYALVELAPAAGFGWEYPFRPALARVAPDGTVTPLSQPLSPPVEVLWLPDASGAVLTVEVTALPGGALAGRLVLQPAAQTPAFALSGRGYALAWGSPARALHEGNCAAFNSIKYQASASRQVDPAARDIQARLTAIGFDAGPADGLYGEQTRAAVIAFQQARGLPTSGDVDCATWQQLLRG